MPEKDKSNAGRKTEYKEEYIELVYKYCLLGLTDVEMSGLFGISEVTFNAWKNKHPEFLKSIKRGKEIADAEVAVSLRERALGYSHSDLHISNYKGKITKTKITKHYPPDPTAAIFWLKNRHPKNWRDKQEIDLKGNVVAWEITIKGKE